MRNRVKFLVALAAGTMMLAASPAMAEHQFQLKNCRVNESGQAITDTYQIYNADDGLGMIPYQTFQLSSLGETKTGKCKGDGKGYCRVFVLGAADWFHVESSKTIFQGDGTSIREYSGVLDCNSDPAS